MNTLGPTERALLVALQEADEPTSDDRDRVRAAVLQRVATASAIAVATWTAASTAGKAGAGLTLAQGSTGLAAATLTAVEGTGAAAGAAGASTLGGAAVVGGTAAKVAGAAVFSSAASKVAAAVVGLSIASGATWYAVDHSADKPHTGVVIVEQQSGPMPVQAQPTPAHPSSALPSTSALATSPADGIDLAEKPARKANRAALRSEAEPQITDSLAEEAELLKRAQQAINGGNAALALALVEEHAERYPSGVLSQERSGLRAISLCRAGAWQQGVAQAQSFLQKNPVSPLSERVRSVCKLEGN